MARTLLVGHGMLKSFCLVAVFAGFACATQPDDPSVPIRLADLDGIHLTVSALNDDTASTLSTTLVAEDASGTNCFELGDDVTATFDGQRVPITTGGFEWRTGDWGGFCRPIAIHVSAKEPGSTTRPVATSTLVISDSSTTWTIEGTGWFANDFVADPAEPGYFTWLDVDVIDDAWSIKGTGTYEAPTIRGNRFDLNGAGHMPATAIYATAQPTATRCEGPGTCALSLRGYHPL